MEQKGPRERWLDTAVRGIRFGPDRRAVREELSAHLEDKEADLRRIFSDLTEEEARERTLKEMGDPEEIGRALARLHRPWLGYLWRGSKWVAAALVLLLLAVSIWNNDHYQSAGYPLWGGFAQVRGPVEGETIQLGGYTFQIVGAAYLDYVQDGRGVEDRVEVYVRVSTPRFWERIDRNGLQAALTLVDGAGREWPMESTAAEGEAPGWNWWLTRAEWGLFHDTFLVNMETDWQEGDRIGLKFAFERGSFTLETDELERVVME